MVSTIVLMDYFVRKQVQRVKVLIINKSRVNTRDEREVLICIYDKCMKDMYEIKLLNVSEHAMRNTNHI